MSGIEVILPAVSMGVLATSVTNQVLLSHGPRLSRWWWKLWGCSSISIYKENLTSIHEWIMLMEYIHTNGSGYKNDSIVVGFTITDETSQNKMLEFYIPTHSFDLTFQTTFNNKPASFSARVFPIIQQGIVLGFEFWTLRWGCFSSLGKEDALRLLNETLLCVRGTAYFLERLNPYFNLPRPSMKTSKSSTGEEREGEISMNGIKKHQ